MTIFFLLIGLELEREIYHGELSSIKKISKIAIQIASLLSGIFGFIYLKYILAQKKT
ncbi:Na+/H+ antiporter NhaA [Flavobacterium flavigenum]|uniref:Na+/H+ antiporter NhaA n=1 Tax=Flavobacterium flavigenum TaxID=3003258 RepID=UPI003D7AC1BD